VVEDNSMQVKNAVNLSVPQKTLWRSFSAKRSEMELLCM